MVDFKKLFGITKKDRGAEDLGKLFDGIKTIFDKRNEQEIRYITGFAGLLGKIAYADMDTSEVELTRIRKILGERMRLSGRRIDPILKLLDEEHAKLFSIEDYIYIRLLNDACDKAQKVDVVRALFEVAAADESVSAEEDAALWTVAKGLRLSHREFIGVRTEFKKHLDVLK